MSSSLRKIATTLVLLGFIVAPAIGISTSYNAGSGVDSVSSSGSYDLDRSTSLKEQTVLGLGELYQNREASGSGKNSLRSSLTGDRYSVNNEIQSSGSLSTRSSAAGNGEGAGVSQKVSMTGDAGFIGSKSSSKENTMVVAGGFDGDGSMSADLSSVAAGRAAVGGSASMDGAQMVDDRSLGQVSSGDLALSVDALYAKPKGGLGEFGLVALNREKGSDEIGSSVNALTGPEYTSDGGRNAAYILSGKRWNTRDPQIRFNLKNDATFSAEGISLASAQGAVAAAGDTWDAGTNQNLFSDSGVGTTTAAADTYDGTNTVAWKAISGSNVLAHCYTWYSTSNRVGGYYSARESDISFNSAKGWSTNGATSSGVYDLQSVALHEMGHTVGLSDLYGKSGYTGDTRQVMHYYTGIKRTLGNGDKTGLWTLYG